MPTKKQTVNLLAYAFDGSNPSPTTTFFLFNRIKVFVNFINSHIKSHNIKS